ncbi:MAG: Cro/CI family transcriptional regulator [Chania sp.]
MYKNTVISHFGGVVNTAAALGIKHPAVCRWGEVIPEKQAMRIDRLTGGKLKYEPELYTKPTSPAVDQ